MQPQGHRRRVPTVDDLKVKLCYICREEERYDAPVQPPRPWTHPCTCTLVAHEACLLRWIQSAQSSRSRSSLSNALKCPQCGTPYELTSSNPWLLRWLDMGNRGLSMIGRIVSVGSLTVVVISLGTGLYILSTAYGAYAVREFLGSEMFDILLTDDPSNWPWHSFINLPLIPLALIFSRLPLKSNVTPLVPLLLAWPTSAPVSGATLNRIFGGAGTQAAATTTTTVQNGSTGVTGKDLFPLLPHWPPPPFILGLFIFPIVREGYKRLFTQLAKWVLNPSGELHGLGQGQGRRGDRDDLRGWGHAAAGADDEPFLRIRVNAHMDEDGPAPGGNRGGAGANDDPDGAGAGGEDAAAAAENTIRVSGTSLGRLIGRALIVPRISSLMGSLLLWLSTKSGLLRRFLAVKPPLRAMASAGAGGRGMGPLGLTTSTMRGGPGTGLGLGLGGLGVLVGPRGVLGGGGGGGLGDGTTRGEMGLLKRLGMAGMLGLSVAWRGTYAWAECDPVWWRNSLGLGLFTIAKDCIHLLHLYLTKREMESRRVKSRSFEGVDVRELDLIDPQAHV